VATAGIQKDFVMFKALSILLLCLLPAATQAGEKSRVMLVLDASGSMWGQIDGVAKITIAQKVIGQLLDTLPPEQELGLTVYGHRRKGDCSDIETILPPAPDQRAAIKAAVDAISPKGKTPLSAAVIAAAEALKYTEEPATVILISDGKETCQRDPCAVGRELEKTGVNFTAHVIGFDVSDPVAKAELQCLAQETGGTFRTASNAAELGEALKVVAAPAPVSVTFRAIAGQNGPEITTPLIWSVTSDQSGAIYQNERAARLRHDLKPGTGKVEVLRPEDEATAEARFTVGEGAMTVTLVLPPLRPSATLQAPDSAIAGADIMVGWQGGGYQDDYVAIARPGSSGGEYIAYTYVKDGNPLGLTMPLQPGTYELRYVLGQDDKIAARRAIRIDPVSASLLASPTTAAGGKIMVTWTGPAYRGDYISIAKRGAAPGDYESYGSVKSGSPLDLQTPSSPGKYELRYIASGPKDVILASRPITVTSVSASLEAADSAAAGSAVVVTWQGPGGESDYISLAAPGDAPSDNVLYKYTREGSPLRLTMPTVPGNYELRYVQSGTRDVVLANRPISVTPVSASLEAADSAAAGSAVVVTWQGPGGESDYISLAAPGDAPGDYATYSYTRDGSPLRGCNCLRPPVATSCAMCKAAPRRWFWPPAP